MTNNKLTLVNPDEMIHMYFGDRRNFYGSVVCADILHLILSISGLVGPRHFWIYVPRNIIRSGRARSGRSRRLPRSLT